MEGRYSKDETLIYVCVDGTCKLPVNELDKALEQLNISFNNTNTNSSIYGN
jgi:hypothetical protein